MNKLLVGAVTAFLAIAQTSLAQTKAPDLCVPPPSGTAPALPAHLMTGQGTEYVHMAITTSNPEAQKFFDQGLAQMHSFWAIESERSFLQAAALDPDAPMPWWGVAMVAAGDYRPRHQLENPANSPGAMGRTLAAAKKAVELSKVPGKATDLEKLYIASIAARRMPGSKNADDAYVTGLRAILAKYPKEVEARTFLSLHLMRGFELPDHTPRPDSMEAVSILRQLLIDAPDHPGVHHYVIHGYEGSSFGSEAWPSCKRYAELVPNIPHALHMPGHIYSTTGKLAEAEKSFSDAAANELGYIQADSLYGTGHHGHNVHYLSTAYAFDGQYDKAVDAARSLLVFKENPRELANVDGNYSAKRQGWFALMRALVLSENWDTILDGQSLPVYDRPREQAWRHWAMGLAQASKGNAQAAMDEAREMDAALKLYETDLKRKPPAELVVGRQELEGHILAAQGKADEASKALGSAATGQRKLRYSEPPYYPRPVDEAIGEISLREGRLPDAEAAFRRCLTDLPGSARSVSGLRETLRRENKTSGAAENRQ
jgi:tetratricopeptide (TPR) repeat protein